MLGFLINEREKEELAYILKRELEEILLDMHDSRIDDVIKDTMRLRYKVLYSLFCRVASEEERIKYIPQLVIH